MSTAAKVIAGTVIGVILLGGILAVGLYFGLAGKNSVV
jgi:hypothetical protein